MSDHIQTLLAYKAAIVFAWLALLFVGERLAPAVDTGRGWFGDWRRLLRNAGLWGLAVVLSSAIVLPLTALAAEHPIWVRPAWWGGWTGLLLDILVLDLWIYWWHRANHLVPALWRFHRVHHLDRFLDVTTAQRFHFGEVAISATVRAAVIVLMAAPLMSVLLFEVLVAVSAGFHHSNLRLPHRLERPLSWLIITPSIHWVHHHRVRRDTDSNYGAILSLWDRLFRSKSQTARTPSMEIGVEGMPEQTFGALLLSPFARGARTAQRL